MRRRWQTSLMSYPCALEQSIPTPMRYELVVRLAAVANNCTRRDAAGDFRAPRTVWDDLWLSAYELHKQEEVRTFVSDDYAASIKRLLS